MDSKLEAMLDLKVWEKLFPVFQQKGIDGGLLAALSQPKYRYGLIEMMEDGTYRFGVPREVSIPKDGGGERLIYVLPDLDRVVMAVIAQVYTRLYGNRIHPNCVSYQEGISVPRILHGIQKKVCSGYKVDLSKYFDSVPIWKIEEMLRSMDSGSPVDRLLWDFYHTNLIERNGQTVEHYKSLGQGVAFSPLLANLCLYSVDEELSGVCQVYKRYSDDILLLGDKADEALQVLKERLAGLGLTLNPKKVQKLSGKEEFTFLGGKVCKDWVHLSDRSWQRRKTAVKGIVKKYGKRGSRSAQRKAVKKLQEYFLREVDGYCILEHLCFLCTDDSDLRRLDEYCRDELKVVFTGKHNRVTNGHKTSNEQLEEMGWVSLVHLYKLYQNSSLVFKAKVKALREQCIAPKEVGIIDSVELSSVKSVNLVSGLVRLNNGKWYRVKRKQRPGVQERLEELWPFARRFEGFTALNTSPDKQRVYSAMELEQTAYSIKVMELLIVTTDWNLEQYYWQSKKQPDLVVFRDWVV